MIENNSLKILEFHKILEMAAGFARTDGGRILIETTMPMEDSQDIIHSIDHVSQWRGLISEGKPPEIECIKDMTECFRKLRPEHAILEPLELREFIPLFVSSMALKKLSVESDYPIVSQAAASLHGHGFLKKAIDQAIESDGRIADDASPELREIRRKLKGYEKRIKVILDNILESKELVPHIQDQFITSRNGRMVIPVKRDSKSSIPGIIHDISKTGETIYVEPRESQHIGNEMESLRSEEKIEEYKVLLKLSSSLRHFLGEIEHDYALITAEDRAAALAAFADDLRMTPPIITDDRSIYIINGRHPVLWKSLKGIKMEEYLVPLNFALGTTYKAMVITGSNAGGKTVALKTIGVILLMALSGMHVPADSGTGLPNVRNLFVDIGDEQSIEENLSTFSSHMNHISDILGKCDASTIVLLDELGTGTDPDEGGALGAAILQHMVEKQALIVATSHLKHVKLFAHTHNEMLAASMGIQTYTSNGEVRYQPTYKLLPGQIGQSHAFEIASSLGLPAKVIDYARGFIKEADMRLAVIIDQYNERRKVYEDNIEEAKAINTESKALRDALREETRNIKITKDEILNATYSMAEQILKHTKEEARSFLDNLKTLDAAKAREQIKIISKKSAQLRELQREFGRPATEAPLRPEVGQSVTLKGSEASGIILNVNYKRERCTVIVNGKEVELPFSELNITGKQARSQDSSNRQGTCIDDTLSNFVRSELNIVGQRVDPALSIVERFLNDAVLSGLTMVRIIHGIGTGTLASAVREMLKAHPLVASFRKGSKEEGGDAITIITL